MSNNDICRSSTVSSSALPVVSVERSPSSADDRGDSIIPCLNTTSGDVREGRHLGADRVSEWSGEDDSIEKKEGKGRKSARPLQVAREGQDHSPDESLSPTENHRIQHTRIPSTKPCIRRKFDMVDVDPPEVGQLAHERWILRVGSEENR